MDVFLRAFLVGEESLKVVNFGALTLDAFAVVTDNFPELLSNCVKIVCDTFANGRSDSKLSNSKQFKEYVEKLIKMCAVFVAPSY